MIVVNKCYIIYFVIFLNVILLFYDLVIFLNVNYCKVFYDIKKYV